MSRLLHVYFLIGAALLALGAAGCSKSSHALQTNAFTSAAPETKAKWDKAMAAAATNDYATAIITLNAIAAQTDLTDDQRTALNQTLMAENDKMFAAAQKGDPQAKASQQEIQKYMLRQQ